jgi:hypothetical protein
MTTVTFGPLRLECRSGSTAILWAALLVLFVVLAFSWGDFFTTVLVTLLCVKAFLHVDANLQASLYLSDHVDNYIDLGTDDGHGHVTRDYLEQTWSDNDSSYAESGEESETDDDSDETTDTDSEDAGSSTDEVDLVGCVSRR